MCGKSGGEINEGCSPFRLAHVVSFAVENVGTEWWCKPNTPKIFIADYQRIKKINSH